MLSKEQANTAAESLLQGRKEQSRWAILKPATSSPVRKWASFFMLVGMGAGTFVNIFLTSRLLPGMGLGMCAGALLGAYFDKQIRPHFMVVIIGVLALGGSWLWYLAHGIA